jgi:hypothetical protein
MDGRGSNPHRGKSGFGAQATFYPIGTVCSFPGVKHSGCEADDLTAEVKSIGAIPPHRHVLMALRLIN